MEMNKDQIAKLEDYLESRKFKVIHWNANEQKKVYSLGVANSVDLIDIIGICEVLGLSPDKIMIGSRYDDLQEEPMFLLGWKGI